MKKNIVWVVVKGERYEGGRVVAVTKHRTTARIIKRDIQREDGFTCIDWVMFKKMTVIGGEYEPI